MDFVICTCFEIIEIRKDRRDLRNIYFDEHQFISFHIEMNVREKMNLTYQAIGAKRSHTCSRSDFCPLFEVHNT